MREQLALILLIVYVVCVGVASFIVGVYISHFWF
jgi:hypothetical protein